MKLNCLSILFISSLVLSLTACGFNEEHIRDYKFYVHSDNQLYINTIDTLVNDFNDCVGSKLFKTTRDTSEYNSSIYFNDNLADLGDNVVGYGTYIRKTSEDNPLNMLTGEKHTVYYIYTGEIRLDTEFIAKNTVNTTADGLNIDKNSDEYTELKKLLFHEAGHVIGLDHTPAQSDVMYYEISGTKNFQDFCQSVRDYLNEND